MRRDQASLAQILGLNYAGDIGPYTCYRTKQGKHVWFLRAPPRSPASEHQRQQRLRWTTVAAAWRSLPGPVRSAWLTLAARSGITATGYNIYLAYSLHPDIAALATLCRRTGINPEDLT